MAHRVSVKLGKEELIIESGKIAKQAGGAVTVQLGETIVLSAACSSKQPLEGRDFFPLTVDYREMTSAAGQYPGGFIKREGRPSEKEILTCRLIDRPLRPLFPEHYRNEVQVMASVISADSDNDPDILAINASSAALLISDMPFFVPVGAVRIGLIDDRFIVNPSYEEREKSSLDLIVAATDEAIVMVEGAAKEISEEKLLESLALAHQEAKKVIHIEKELAKECGKTKQEAPTYEELEKFVLEVKKDFGSEIDKAFSLHKKQERQDFLDGVLEKAVEKYVTEESEITPTLVHQAFSEVEYQSTRTQMIQNQTRVDGRAFTDIRPIATEVGLLPRTHGSSLFTRGETQALVIVTLGTGDDEQLVDGLTPSTSKKFMLHYNFPPYCVGETKPVRGVSRREIGHGALAERALAPVLPSEEDFPYTIRVVSTITESNGSSSMASVCGGALAMLDAGIPIKASVAGIAMGLVKEGDDVVILSDIQGVEDHLGDMDFKITGTRDGLTAVQMDIKIAGVTSEIMTKALQQAREGRLHILDKMAETLKEPRAALSKHAPQYQTIKIHPDKIREVIGSGGKVIRGIVDATGAQIDIEDDGLIKIFSVNAESGEQALQIIKDIVLDPEVGKTYKATVKKLMPFGCFVEILPGKEGLVHISQLAMERVEKVEDVVSLGDEIMVKLTEIDKQGRLNLSHKAVLVQKEQVNT